MWTDRVSNPGPLTYESGALPTALRGRLTGGYTGISRSYEAVFQLISDRFTERRREMRVRDRQEK